MEQIKSTDRKKKLDKLVAAYAEIWADVLLDKNLDLHYLQIREDLEFLEQLIKLKDAGHQDTLMFSLIANQLNCLRAIVFSKLSGSPY
ncbi:MAG: hypothetical protein ABWY16_20265 [Pedobacter sp.]|uniref:hypothetical protein n=1 Tax=Pedobacter sp. TaxID=1411316 RepID=UPI0033972F68